MNALSFRSGVSGDSSRAYEWRLGLIALANQILNSKVGVFVNVYNVPKCRMFSRSCLGKAVEDSLRGTDTFFMIGYLAPIY